MNKSKESFNKKEKEKQRFKLQREKQQKKEERKANKKKGATLEDMMAYLDENGNLTDSPPDPSRMKKIKAEDIQIGVPRQPDTPEEMATGVVTFFNESKGFGFITDDRNQRVFFHVNDISEQLKEQDKVKFRMEAGPRGLSALQVIKA